MSIRVYKRKHKNTITWTASVTVRGITPQRKPHTRGGFPTREQADQYAKAKEQELLGRLEGIPKLKGVRFDSFAIEYLELCKKNNTQKHYATKNYVILKSIGIVINGGKNNVIENNIAVDCRYMLRTWSPAKY